MSKKIMKRSLALGALMAFVITGSAMAAEMNLTDENTNNGVFTAAGIGNQDNLPSGAYNEGTWKLGKYTLLVNKEAQYGYAVWAHYNIQGDDGSSLIIKSTDDKKLTYGLGVNGVVNVDNLIIESSDHAIYAAAKTDIDAKNINLSADQYVIYTEPGCGVELDVDAAETATINGSIFANGAKTVSVSAGKMEMLGNVYSLNSDVSVDLGKEGSLTGQVVAYDNSTAFVDLGTESTWNVTGDSWVTGLAGNDAKINNATAGDATVTVNNAKWDYSTLGNKATNSVIKDSTINLTGVDLIVNSAYNTASYSGGVIQNTTINSDASVIINQTGKDNAIGNGKNTIIAEKIELNSSNASAIYCQENSGCITNLEAKEIILTSNFGGHTAAGVYTASGATVNITEFEKLKVYSTCEVENEGAHGITANNSTVNIVGSKDAKSTIIIESDGHSALSAIYGGNLTVTADEIDVSTEKFRNDSSAYKSGVIGVRDSSTMVINVDEKLKVTDNHKRIGANSTNAIKVTDGSLTIHSKADTVIEIDGNITQTAGSIDLALQNDKSSVTGAINTATAGADIAFKNNSVWNNNGASKVAKLTLDNGVINQNTSENITIGLYSGNGTVNYGANSGDVFINDGSGSLNLAMVGATDMEKVANKISVQKAIASNIKAMIVEPEGDVKGETIAEVDYQEADQETGYRMGTLGKVVEKVNTKNQSIGEAGVSLKLHWRSHMNDMNKRMGELRNANGEHGVWTRMVRGESEYENTVAQYNQYQLGYDEKLSVDKRWTVGAAVTFAEGDSNYGYGTTDDKSTAFAIYGTKLNNDGTFVDLIARYAHLESEYDDVNSGKGDYSTNGMSVSAEFGKRIQQGNGLWIEPQVELTYGTVDSAEFQLGGKTVQVGDMDSIIGRVGFSLGKDIKQGNVYARASYLYDFDGETENAFSNATDSRTIAEDLGGGWWEVGVGANINLSKATYIYADVEKTFGGEVDTNWQWNLGVRYSF